MNIEVKRASIEEKSILRNLLELYQYDFSEFEGNDLKVIPAYTKGDYHEVYQNDEHWVGPVQMFLSKGGPKEVSNE